MKKIANIILSLLILVGCQEKYELNVDFQLPTHLDSPTAIQLDITSAEPVVLSWTGGGAADGGIVLYEVLFDKEGGDFSNPLVSLKSDQGALPRLTLTHAALNTIARNAGILPQETGKLIWTVRASKGGVLKESDIQSAITVTRGEGIDNIPSQLFLYHQPKTTVRVVFPSARWRMACSRSTPPSRQERFSSDRPPVARHSPII
nr:SusE domain-containing protein [Petrimonas mucosa]